MFIILAHCHSYTGAAIDVPKRDNGKPALYATRGAAEDQAERWNRKMKNIGLIPNRYYHVYNIN